MPASNVGGRHRPRAEQKKLGGRKHQNEPGEEARGGTPSLLAAAARPLPAAAPSSGTVAPDGSQFGCACVTPQLWARYPGDAGTFQECLQKSHEHDENKKG